MESFTRRIEAEDESDSMEFSSISDNGFVSSKELHSEVSEASSPDFLDELLSSASTGSISPYLKRTTQFEGPEFLRRLNVFEEVEHGGRVTFECQCKAHPVPVSKWYKDDVELVEGDRMKIENSLETDGTLRLIISNARKSDEGAYRCKLENQEGVAATTGYLSVTGNSSSPKSEHAISAAPLLRAITEESNVSQDSEEGATSSSTSLEKILSGEYDVTTLPYSHYLELLKESGGLNSELGRISAPGNSEKKGRNGTPTEDTARADDIKNLCTDFAYDTSSVTDDDDDSYFNDHLVTKAMNQTEIDAEEFANRPKSEVIFGTPFLTDSKPVFVIEGRRKDVSARGLDSELLENSEEKLEEMENELGFGLSLEGAQGEENAKAKAYDADLEFGSQFSEPSMGRDWQGDFGKEGVLESLDENRMRETVIAGRIGMPSDWEFAHYTSEGDEVEEILNAIPADADATPRLPVETSKHEEEEAVPDAEIQVSPLGDEVAVSASKNLADRASDPRGVALLRDARFVADGQETSEDEKIINVREEAADAVPGNSVDSVSSSYLPDKMTASVAEENIKRSDKADVEDISPLGSSDRIILADIQPEEVKAQAGRDVTPEIKPKDKLEKDGDADWMPEMTSDAELVSSVPSLVNCNANSAISEEADGEAHKPEVCTSRGDGLTQSTDTAGFHFANLMSDVKPSVTISSDWSPGVSISRYLPDLSPRELASEEQPVGLEEIVAELVMDEAGKEPMSAIDWCVDWFRYPSIFYVLLVLTTTLVASATQMNPSLVVLIVALCSIFGFHLFPPVHEAQED